jgi:MbtH protein
MAGNTMMEKNSEDQLIYEVVVNSEGQYSIWRVDKQRPEGWREANKVGTRGECLGHIAKIWTDIRPLSLQKKMGFGSSDKADTP